MWPSVTYTFSPSTTIKSSEVNQNFTDVLNNVEEGVPTGIGGEWFTNTAPTGWLLQDGSAVSRATYSRLFAVIGTAFGAGDGSTTFNIPNKKGKVGVGRDAAQAEFDTLGETGGEKTHLLTTAEIPAHQHTGTTGNDSPDHSHSGTTGNDSPDHTHGIPWAASNNSGTGGGGPDAGATASGGASVRHTHPFTSGGASVRHTHPFTTDSAGGGGAHNNLQPYLVQNFIIKD